MKKIARYTLLFFTVIFLLNLFINNKDPLMQDILNANLGFFKKGHILGTDDLGRDILSRLSQGFFNSFLIVISTILICFVISLIVGSIMGYYEGKIDDLLMFLIEILISIPNILIILLILIYFSNKIYMIIICLSFTRSLRMILFVRNEMRKFKIQNYVIISRSMGASFYHILRYHFIPNFKDLFIIKLSFLIPGIVFTESFLSFLGVGVKIPNASLGNLISSGFKILFKNPNQFLFASLILLLITLSFEGREDDRN